MANFLTTDRTLCYHDPVPGTMLHIIGNDERTIGASGPELMTEFEALSNFYPSAPWVVLLRNPDEAQASFDALMNRECVRLNGWATEAVWEARKLTLKQLCVKPMVMAIDTEDLDDEGQASRVWNWLLPNIQFDHQRWKLLKNLNIQQHFTKRLTLLAKEGI
jgi:hypothetical protein